MTLRSLANILSENSIELPKSYHNEIISYACDVPYDEVVSNPLNQYKNKEKQIMSVVDRLIAGVPLQYITNRAFFYGREFFVNEEVLIPRVDSELLIDISLEKIKSKIQDSKVYRIADICCGTGCLGITLAKELQSIGVSVELTLFDVSKKIADIAKINCKKHGIYASIVDVNVLEEEGFDIGEDIDFIICNPPYISQEEYVNLDEYVKKEPKIALVPESSDVLIFYKSVAKIAKQRSAKLCFEISYNKGADVMKALEEIFSEKSSLELYKDLGGNNRAIYADV